MKQLATNSSEEIKQFEIYWAKFDPSQGSEIKKTRPCVVVSPDVMNSLLNTVLVVPLTKTLIDWPFRLLVNVAGKQSSLACDHLRSISKERLGTKIGLLKPEDQSALLGKIQAIFESPNSKVS